MFLSKLELLHCINNERKPRCGMQRKRDLIQVNILGKRKRSFQQKPRVYSTETKGRLL